MDIATAQRRFPQIPRKPRKRSPRRGRYVSKACLDCRRRKIKCSGDLPCQSCLLETIECCYAVGPARVRKRSHKSPSNATLFTALSDKHSVDEVQSQTVQNEPSCPETDQQQALTPQNLTEDTSGSTISSLAVDHSNGHPIPVFQPDIRGSSAVFPGISSQRMREIDINRWNVQGKLLEVQRMRSMVGHYMARINPRIPCLNEAQLHHNIEALLAGQASTEDQLQMMAIVDLVMAVIQVMTDEATETHSLTPAGWIEFQRADQLLSRAAWNGVSNLRSIQCLALKTIYLIFTNRENLAYDTAISMTRMCLQLGLHNEKTWGLCSPFEVHLRQRIFWTAFCLERHVAESCKLPYLIRLSDLNVALPLQIDDRNLKANLEGLPPEDPSAPIHHIYYCYRHAMLFTEVWDSLTQKGAEDRTNQSIITKIDEEIESLRCEIPQFLRWNSNILIYEGRVDTRQRFCIREGLLLHLLLNSLRLLPRRPLFEDAADIYTDMVMQCVDIAADSIQSLQAYYQTSLPDIIERHISTRYLLESLQVLAEVILLKQRDTTMAMRYAKEIFENGVSLLKRFASRLAFARTALDGIQHIVVKISNMREQSLLSGSLDDCFHWFDFLAMDNLEDVCDLGGLSSPSRTTDLSAQPNPDPLQYIHTNSWLTS